MILKHVKILSFILYVELVKHCMYLEQVKHYASLVIVLNTRSTCRDLLVK